MARYRCETADHEGQSHGFVTVGEGAMLPPGRWPACNTHTPDGACGSFLYECSWCPHTATAHAVIERDLIHACDEHADYLDAWGAELPRCAECGDAVAWPTEWFCTTCSHAINLLEASL
jgi:hypothetical protein